MKRRLLPTFRSHKGLVQSGNFLYIGIISQRLSLRHDPLLMSILSTCLWDGLRGDEYTLRKEKGSGPRILWQILR